MKKGNILIILIIIAALVITAALFVAVKQTNLTPFMQKAKAPLNQVEQKKIRNDDQLKSYISKDLKISFKYPKDWYIDEKDFDIMVTSYITRIGENKPPDENQIKVFIDNFNGCHSTIEENLIDLACGEGGSTVAKNKILSKETSQTKGGTFYKYVIQTPNSTFTYYLVTNKDRVLHIEKHPDPSQFDKEFEEIINSIQFL